MNQRLSDSKKIMIIIGLLACSTLIGFYDRVQPKIATGSAVSVLPKSSILVIPIEGMISTAGSEWSPSMVDIVVDQLDKATDSKTVKAVVLRVNSPGGTVGASQEIFDAILRFKETSQKPVIVSIMDIGASGAYWISLAADAIFSHSGSIVGSLGVITQTLDLTEVPKKYGVNVRTYKAGQNKDLLNPWRNTTRDERMIIQSMLDNVHEQFKDTLIKHRNITKERASKIADGRVFSGEMALKEGLIDYIGSFYDATTYAGKLVGLENPNIVFPNQGIKDWVNSFRAMVSNQFSLGQFFGHSQLMY